MAVELLDSIYVFIFHDAGGLDMQWSRRLPFSCWVDRSKPRYSGPEAMLDAGEVAVESAEIKFQLIQVTAGEMQDSLREAGTVSLLSARRSCS